MVYIYTYTQLCLPYDTYIVYQRFIRPQQSKVLVRKIKNNFHGRDKLLIDAIRDKHKVVNYSYRGIRMKEWQPTKVKSFAPQIIKNDRKCLSKPTLDDLYNTRDA